MARKPATKPAETATDGTAAEEVKPKRTIIRARDASAWNGLLKKASEQHWRRLKVTIQITDKLLAGKPKSLNVAEAMLKARGLNDFVATAEDVTDPTEREKLAKDVATNAVLCEFNRREGHPGVWIPSNNLKAMLKENWSVLGLRMKVRGSRGALAEGLFVVGENEDDWVKVGDAPDGVYDAVVHVTGPQGPMSSVKRHEFVSTPKLTFIVMIANAENIAEKISDDELASVFTHAAAHGTGASRSQGFGKFKVVSVEEIEHK